MTSQQSGTVKVPMHSITTMEDDHGISHGQQEPVSGDNNAQQYEPPPLVPLPIEKTPSRTRRPSLPKRRRSKMRFDPSLQHKWTHSEANHLYETLEELERKVAQCLQNQTLVYRLLEKVEELDDRFRKYARGNGVGLGRLNLRPVPTAAVPRSATDEIGFPVAATQNTASKPSRVVVLTTSYNPDHIKPPMTQAQNQNSTQPQQSESVEEVEQQQPSQGNEDISDIQPQSDGNDNSERDEETGDTQMVYEIVNVEDLEWGNESDQEQDDPPEVQHEEENPVQGQGSSSGEEIAAATNNEYILPGGRCDTLIPTEVTDTNITAEEGKIQEVDYIRKSRHCPICSKVIISTWGLNRHMLAVHSIGKPLECKICNVMFTRRDALQAHQFREHGKDSPDTRKVVKHGKLVTRRVTSKDIQYECLTCTRTFLTEQELQEHQMQEHSIPERPFRCQICLTDEYFDKDGMQRHVLASHPIRGSSRLGGVCPVCGNNTSTKWHLNRHMLSLHGIGVPKTCTICGQEFARKYRLRLHQLRQHGTMSEDLDAKTSQGPFICPVCSKEFKSKSTLVGHIPGCQGLKPFLCDECGQGFSHRSGVRQHKLAFHQQIKNHFCPVCQKGFFDLGHYNRHMTTHSGVKRNKMGGTKSEPKCEDNLPEISEGCNFSSYCTQPVEIIEVYIPDGEHASFNLS